MILDINPKSDAPPASTSATTSPGPLRLTDKPGSKHEKELVAALERRCKSLEAQLTKANRDLKSACSDAARARNETGSSKKQDEIWSMIQREYLASRLKKQYRELSNQNEEKGKGTGGDFRDGQANQEIRGRYRRTSKEQSRAEKREH